MDKIYQILKTNSSSINYILLACAAFSSITTLERADYNLFLFLFIAYTMFWDNENLKKNNTGNNQNNRGKKGNNKNQEGIDPMIMQNQMINNMYNNQVFFSQQNPVMNINMIPMNQGFQRNFIMQGDMNNFDFYHNHFYLCYNS